MGAGFLHVRGLEDMVKGVKALLELGIIVTMWCVFDWRVALASFLAMWLVNVAIACSKE